MGIILHEPPYTRQPRQRTARLVPMDDSEFCHPDGQLLVAAIARVEDQAVARAVHGFERPFLLLDVEDEHIVFVVLPVPGGFPELAVVQIRRDN